MKSRYRRFVEHYTDAAIYRPPPSLLFCHAPIEFVDASLIGYADASHYAHRVSERSLQATIATITNHSFSYRLQQSRFLATGHHAFWAATLARHHCSGYLVISRYRYQFPFFISPDRHLPYAMAISLYVTLRWFSTTPIIICRRRLHYAVMPWPSHAFQVDYCH